MANQNPQAESSQFIELLNTNGQSVEFEQTISLIDRFYDFSPVAFNNEEQVNEVGTNLGSCKILAFAMLHQLSEQATLNCFGRFCREDVMQNPEGSDHGNIRNFIQFGWQGVLFSGQALEYTSKSDE